MCWESFVSCETKILACLSENQNEDKVILKTFLRWVRTSANFFEVPWLIIEPKVSIIPSAWNNISGTFLTVESFGISLNWFKNWNSFLFFFAESFNLFYFKIVCLDSNSSLSKRECKLFKEDNIRIWRNIEELVVFKDQLDGVVFIGVNGVGYSKFRSLFQINCPQ